MLNLLPPTKKQTIEQDQLYHFIQRCCLIVISCTIVLSVVMVVTRFIANFVLDNVQTRSTMLVKAPDQANVTKQLSDLTTLSTDIHTIQKDFHQPLPIVLQMLNHLPANISFTTLNLDYAKTSIKVTGIAQNRDQLLQLSQMINNESTWTNVKFPLQDFTQKTNIPFEFEVTLTPSQ